MSIEHGQVLVYRLALTGTFAALTVPLADRVHSHLTSPGRRDVIFQMYTAAEYCDRNLPATATIGAFDGGAFGYFTDASVVNLDGLMNNRQFLPYLRLEKPLLDYLREKQIGWLMHIERKGRAAPSERLMAGRDR